MTAELSQIIDLLQSQSCEIQSLYGIYILTQSLSFKIKGRQNGRENIWVKSKYVGLCILIHFPRNEAVLCNIKLTV